jgi:hypothetical protein
MTAQGDCAAAFQVTHRLQMAGQHPVSMILAVSISLLLEDLGQLGHVS